MLNYEASWTELSLLKKRKEKYLTQIWADHYNNHRDTDKHHPDQRLISSPHPTHHWATKTLKKNQKSNCFLSGNKSGRSHLRTLLWGKVKWCWTAVVSARREGEGPAVFWRRQRSVQSNRRAHFGLWILMSSCCFCPAQQKHAWDRVERRGRGHGTTFFLVIASLELACQFLWLDCFK